MACGNEDGEVNRMTNPAKPGNSSFMLTRAIKSLASLAAAASLAIMGYAGDFSSPSLIALSFGFAAWLCAPYAVAWIAAGRLKSDAIASGVLGVGLTVITGLGLYAYVSVFIINPKPDAQDGLAFLVIPFYQLGTIALACALAFLVKRLRRA